MICNKKNKIVFILFGGLVDSLNNSVPEPLNTLIRTYVIARGIGIFTTYLKCMHNCEQLQQYYLYYYFIRRIVRHCRHARKHFTLSVSIRSDDQNLIFDIFILVTAFPIA